MSEERESTYWICDGCADQRGWVMYKTGNTTIRGLCGWCTFPLTVKLTPTRDFKKPIEKGKTDGE